ncbi:MAG: alpha/beta hydrolase [Flavobacteriaceae bacterium]|nr:alpha/beta hydrolase [Flavobacteriaceae bacterium]|tara:strand:+ start:16699 stop:17622 length:924 start_codon:yes stop_codon:yes gene_type:complete
MKHLWLSLLALLLVASLTVSCSSSDDSTPSDDTTQTDDTSDDDPSIAAASFTDVSYGDNPQQVYDIYLPEDRSEDKTKVIILVHGGGWIEGDKADMAEILAQIRADFPDHAVVNMNYVLANPGAGVPAFPNQFLDIDRVIDQLTAQRGELLILPEFGLLGTSAGAHISLMYDYVYDEDDQVKFVADIVGPTDFTDPFYADDPNFDLLLQFLVDETQYPAGTDLAQATSPVYQVSASASPTIMFYGDADPLVPLTNGDRLDTTLSDAMIDHSYTIYEGGHGDDWSPESYIDLQVKLRAFITNYLPVIP